LTHLYEEIAEEKLTHPADFPPVCGARGCVLGMFNSQEVKVLYQPDGGEGK
jgi:hypothetical protein